MPKNYEIGKGQINYYPSYVPVYTLDVAAELHGKEIDDESEDTFLITTKVICNPIP